MKPALVYQGAFELNFERLKPGATTYHATDGSSRPLAAPSIDGLVVGYMEKTGKKFSAVRLRFEDRDIILKQPLLLEPMRHMGSRRFTPRPIFLDDELISTILDDVLAQNPGQQAELALLINRINQVRRGDRPTIE